MYVMQELNVTKKKNSVHNVSKVWMEVFVTNSLFFF